MNQVKRKRNIVRSKNPLYEDVLCEAAVRVRIGNKLKLPTNKDGEQIEVVTRMRAR